MRINAVPGLLVAPRVQPRYERHRNQAQQKACRRRRADASHHDAERTHHKKREEKYAGAGYLGVQVTVGDRILGGTRALRK